MSILDEGFADVTAVYSLPDSYRKRLRTSNSIERLNEELRRRERVLRIFSNEESLLRLMGAVLMTSLKSSLRGMKRDRLLLLPIKPLNNGEISLSIMS